MKLKKKSILSISLVMALSFGAVVQAHATTNKYEELTKISSYSSAVTYTGQSVYNKFKNEFGWEVVNSTALYNVGFSFHNLNGANGYDMKIGTTPSDGWGLDSIIAEAINVSESSAAGLVNRYMIDKDRPENTNKKKYTYKLGEREIVFSQDEYDYVTGYYSLAVYIGPKMKDYANHWAEDAIQDFIDKGYMGGYSDGTFRPDNFITRGEFVTIVNNYFGLTKSSGKVFSDTKNHWAKHAIDVAVTNGICNGKTATEFKPNAPMTREEASVMMASYKKVTDRNYDKLSKYRDAYKVSSWAKPGVEGSIEKGYMGGYSDNTFKPKNKITRAEAVVTLSRISK